jgi:DNA-damage-inducible protein D
MSNLKLFDSKQIRTAWHEETKQWLIVVADAIQVLIDTTNPTEYIKKMRKSDMLLSQGWGQIVIPLSVDTPGGKQKLNCSNAQGLLRIIQSITPLKAAPFKLWLAQVGSERSWLRSIQ